MYFEYNFMIEAKQIYETKYFIHYNINDILIPKIMVFVYL